MPKTVGVTHADLAPSRRSTELGSKTGVAFIVVTIICGLFCFVLCLIAEATRSQEKWVESGEDGKDVKYECIYSGSGKMALLCSAVAFVGLAVVMLVEHMYMLIAVSKSPPPVLLSWDPDSTQFKTLTWQAGFFFVTTWLCFAVAEILLLIGLSVESGHLKNWSKPRESCLIIREGLFCAAGVLTLMTVFLAAGLYLTALHAQKLFQQQQLVRQQVLETTVLYTSPPGSPPHRLTTMAREDPVITELPNQPPPFSFSGGFQKAI
ncbi:hypothetical protein ERO13_D10G175100v2 [Gossypium hirsutum]|uniref:Transmembrane protein n=4 Tax=Gossypium TaxID=3633 RepID=A0ABM3AWC8_GOSHI|nr:uncharacterized protein LOC107895503 [Gossypium hirsutum]KAG4126751.1 hypothetical protein ERO13_D10G175100v2 [Gossypium hirsutum]MBA0725384.1 hypothetical protein [Gossypium laxum]TYH50529.1 hypothetical protein ES332_D10G213000v1 [Gossypium tomentosum]TYI61808.1 hypothetical protein E1A91_D10G199500v1 [Gossypium mustelinum]